MFTKCKSTGNAHPSGDRAWDQSHITWHLSVRLLILNGKCLASLLPSFMSLGKFQSFPCLSFPICNPAMVTYDLCHNSCKDPMNRAHRTVLGLSQHMAGTELPASCHRHHNHHHCYCDQTQKLKIKQALCRLLAPQPNPLFCLCLLSSPS